MPNVFIVREIKDSVKRNKNFCEKKRSLKNWGSIGFSEIRLDTIPKLLRIMRILYLRNLEETGC